MSKNDYDFLVDTYEVSHKKTSHKINNIYYLLFEKL